MQDVIVDRPRTGGQYDYKQIRRSQKNQFNQLSKVGMKKPYGWEHKSQSDVLGPLKGFLKSNVGRPWNKVWSEVCEKTDSRTILGSHLRDHIRWMVELDVEVLEDGVYTRYGRYSRYPLRRGFYVNPDTGILCYIENKPFFSSYKKQESKLVRYHGLTFYKYDGIWYEVSVLPIPDYKGFTYGTYYDEHRRIHYNRDRFGYYLHSHIWLATGRDSCSYNYGESVYCTSKKQIGKRMIRKIERFINETR